MAVKKENLRFVLKMQNKYRKKRGSRMVCDWKRAISKDATFIKKFFNRDGYEERDLIETPGQFAYDLAKRYDVVIDELNRNYLKVRQGPENQLVDYMTKRDIFGNVRRFHQLAEEVRGLLLAGERLKGHSRRLQRKYHLPKIIIEREAYEIALRYQGLTAEDFDREKKYFLLFDGQDLNNKTQKNSASNNRLKRKGEKKELQGKEITKEEYKQRFGYYPKAVDYSVHLLEFSVN